MALFLTPRDLRTAVRTLARSRGATAVILLSLALGTGVNAAVYGVLDALLLRSPAGIVQPSRLVTIYTSEFSGAPYGQSSYPDFVSIREQATAFDGIAAIDDDDVQNVQLGDSGHSARVAAVSEDFFRALQMPAFAGRLLAAADSALDPPGVVVSFALSEQLGGATQILGKTVTIGGHAYAVVGVAPPRFQGLLAARECDAWILLARPAEARGNRRLALVARLAPGATIDAAAESLRRISDDLAGRYPATNQGSIAQAEAPRRITATRYSPLDPAAKGQIVLIGIIVGGASAALLASACLNLGSLLLSRAVARQRDLVIKMALGATRSTLIRESLAETLCLSLAGGGLGLLFAVWTARAIPALFMVEQAEALETGLDLRVLLLTVGLACAAGAIFGIGPALQGTAGTASRTAIALRADAGGVSPHHGGVRLRTWLVTGQIALSTVLLLATGLLVANFSRVLEADPGSTVAKVALASIELPGRFADPVRGVAARRRLIEQLQSRGDVEAVGWAGTLPLGRGNRRRFRVEAGTAGVTDTVTFATNVVSEGYFRALALPQIEGRSFGGGDAMLSPPVVVVDELLARRYFGPAATGHHLIDEEDVRLEVVGVVRSGRYRTLQEPPQPTVYYPATQDYLWRGALFVRAHGDPVPLLEAISEAVERVGDGATILRQSTLARQLSEALTIDRLTTTLVGLCGAIALAMSALGVYGVMTDAVRRRTREIGLRVALGAGPGQVGRLVFGEALSLAAAGLLIGTAAALAVARAARVFVSGGAALDLGAMAAAAGVLAAVIALAAVLPLRRALRVSPNIALRTGDT